MKKRTAIFLLLVFLFSVFTGLAISAEEIKPLATLTVSEEDENGDTTVSLKVYNVVFSGVQASVAYNPEAAEIKDCSGKLLTENNEKLFTVIRAEEHKNEEYFSVISVLNFSMENPSAYVNSEKNIVAGEDGVEVVSITFHRIGQGDFNIGFASEESGRPYDKSAPFGFVIANSGGEKIDTVLNVIKPERETEIYYSTPSKLVKKSDALLRTERMTDTVFLQIGNYAAVYNGKLFWIDDNNKAVVPYLKNDRTMVPLRFIGEKLGLTVDWDEAQSKITLSAGDTKIEMFEGNPEYLKNGETLKMDSPPEIISDRTFVPLRAVAEAFDRDVSWIESKSCVIIAPSSMPWNSGDSISARLLDDAMFIMSAFVRDLK